MKHASKRQIIDALRRNLQRDEPCVEADGQAMLAAVLAPLYWHQRSLHLLYTLRTEAVETHRGQVSFPGGAIEGADRGSLDAALREAEEEIGIDPKDVEFIGYLEPYLTITGYCIIPIIGSIPWPYDLDINQQEVAAVFGVPLEWLAKPDHLQTIQYLENGSNQPVAVYSFLPFQGHIIWGATARITVDLMAKIGSIAKGAGITRSL